MGAFILYWLSKILVALFFAGLIGSAIVVVITFVEDGKLLLEGKEQQAKPQADAAHPSTAAAREAF